MILTHDSLLGISQGESPMIHGISPDLVKSESIDLPIGDMIHRTKAAALPNNGEKVCSLIEHFSRYSFEVRNEGSSLEAGASYIIPIPAQLAFGQKHFGQFSAKSSTAREAISARVICDGYNGYDHTPPGYNGPIYLEVSPLCFNTRVTPKIDIVQMRVKTQTRLFRLDELEVKHSEYGIIRDSNGQPIPTKNLDLSSNGIFFHVDLRRPIVGFESRGNPIEEVFLNAKGTLDWRHFWRQLTAEDCKNGELILERDRFYLLTTTERVVIPPDACGELTIYEPGSGDFRTQYASFFDRHFGYEAGGTHIVLEVRARDMHQRICHGQRICNMVFEEPDCVSPSYGAEMKSNYTTSQPCLAKHYAGFDTAWIK